jgi:hypothetical protein
MRSPEYSMSMGRCSAQTYCLWNRAYPSGPWTMWQRCPNHDTQAVWPNAPLFQFLLSIIETCLSMWKLFRAGKLTIANDPVLSNYPTIPEQSFSLLHTLITPSYLPPTSCHCLLHGDSVPALQRPWVPNALTAVTSRIPGPYCSLPSPGICRIGHSIGVPMESFPSRTQPWWQVYRFEGKNVTSFWTMSSISNAVRIKQQQLGRVIPTFALTWRAQPLRKCMNM